MKEDNQEERNGKETEARRSDNNTEVYYFLLRVKEVRLSK